MSETLLNSAGAMSQDLQPLPPSLWASCLGLLLLFATGSGCGTSKDPVGYQPSEEKRVEFRVSGTQDAQSDPERYRALFVEGSAPDDQLLQQHKKYHFYAKSVEISGETAIASVGALDAETGEERGTVQWKLQRVDDRWLIADAPLP